MKKFIQLIALFTSVLLFFILIIIYATNCIVNNKANFKLNKNIKNIIVGHSHSECAYNDTLLNSFKNFSQSGESYFYTYQKVKKILSQNNQIENIFIEFSNNQIEVSMDKWIWGDEYMSYGYPKYAPFMNSEDNKLLILNNFDSYYNNLSLLLKNNINHIYKSDFNFSSRIGEYLWLEKDKTDSLIANNDTMNIKLESVIVSNENIKYLKKIVDFCNKNKVDVYLIRSPQHRLFPKRSNEEIFIRIKDSLFKNVEFLDFNNFPIKNSEFGDFEHLNHKGAKVLSEWLDKIILKGLLLNTNKKKYIKKEIIKKRTLINIKN